MKPDKTELERRIGVALRFIQWAKDDNSKTLENIESGKWAAHLPRKHSLENESHRLELIRKLLSGEEL